MAETRHGLLPHTARSGHQAIQAKPPAILADAFGKLPLFVGI